MLTFSTSQRTLPQVRFSQASSWRRNRGWISVQARQNLSKHKILYLPFPIISSRLRTSREMEMLRIASLNTFVWLNNLKSLTIGRLLHTSTRDALTYQLKPSMLKAKLKLTKDLVSARKKFWTFSKPWTTLKQPLRRLRIPAFPRLSVKSLVNWFVFTKLSPLTSPLVMNSIALSNILRSVLRPLNAPTTKKRKLNAIRESVSSMKNWVS